MMMNEQLSFNSSSFVGFVEVDQPRAALGDNLVVEEGSSGFSHVVSSQTSLVADSVESEESKGWSEDELFHGSWADEVEKEEELFGIDEGGEYYFIAPPKGGNINRSKALPKPKPKSKKKKKTKAKKPEYKLFVGGIIFADLEEHLFEMEESIGEEMEPELMFTALETLKKLRIDCFESMFEEFGKVRKIKPNWEKRFCHVVYDQEEDAIQAFAVLGHADERKKRRKEFMDLLESSGLPRFAAPLHNFYVRQTKGTTPSTTATLTKAKKGKGKKVVPAHTTKASAQSQKPKVQKQDDDLVSSVSSDAAANQICYWMVVAGSETTPPNWGVLNPQPPSVLKTVSTTTTTITTKTKVVHSEGIMITGCLLKERDREGAVLPPLSDLPPLSLAA